MKKDLIIGIGVGIPVLIIMVLIGGGGHVPEFEDQPPIHELPDSDSYEFSNSEFTEFGKYDVEIESVSYSNHQGFLAKPNSSENFPGIVMIHEWWGLNDNIKDTAQKLASHGYVVLAVDLFGDVATDAQKASQMISEFDQASGIINMNSAVEYLHNHSVEKVGSIGWCFGGGQSLNLALNSDLDASVIYYGKLVTDSDELSKIDWPVLGIFAELDKGIPVSQVSEFEKVLNQLKINNEIIVYPGVDHAFANPTGERYAPIETADAWSKTLRFFNENLK
ncbi:MAG TPA: dienelactone hydrolase family protein [Nitrosopumilus sp.]|nr:dienelactone hydrolase family protein [Thermoproteota archaeon]HJJ23229.1 dienelactone hydrolase family protein [Nitrosopumilus sp.]